MKVVDALMKIRKIVAADVVAAKQEEDMGWKSREHAQWAKRQSDGEQGGASCVQEIANESF